MICLTKVYKNIRTWVGDKGTQFGISRDGASWGVYGFNVYDDSCASLKGGIQTFTSALLLSS